jgi:multiple sugar transport system permease protein
MAAIERTAGTPQPIGYTRSPAGMVGSVLRWIALILAGLLFLIPFYLVLRNALSTEADITAPTWKFFPTNLQWGNISELFNDQNVPMARALYNSAVVGILGTGGQLLLASMAGYGLARIPYKHADKVFYAIVATLMIPAAVSFIPGSTSWASRVSWKRRPGWTGQDTSQPSGGSSCRTRCRSSRRSRRSPSSATGTRSSGRW